ncbi:hypothetical protein Trydic_g17476 [Trypoxylus dichotomus]
MLSELPEDDVLQLGIQIFGLIGENLNRTTRKVAIYRLFNTTVFACILYFVLANCFRERGVMLVKTIESAITMIHILAKYTAFMYGKREIRMVIEDRLKFWNPKDVDAKLSRGADKIYRYTKIVQKSLLFAIVTSVQFHLLKPFFNSVDVFPFNVWIVYDSFLLRLAVLAAQYYCLCICTAIVLSYDVMYCSICVHVIVQLRLLKFKVRKMSGNARDELRMCVVHYQLLERRVDLADKVELILYMATMYSEFGYYSIPVEGLSSEFSDIANAVYMSSWYEENPVIRRSLLITMIKAQTSKYLNGGGIIQINVDAFGSVSTERNCRKPYSDYQSSSSSFSQVFRKSFSLYLVLKNLIK